MKALLSIHDLMPDTLDRVLEMLETLVEAEVPPARTYLLVVPGLPWSDSQLQVLGELQRRGYPLAGHGWYHRIRRKAGLKHRLHGALISRNAAEHLSLTTAEIRDLLERNYRWFAQQGLQSPALYVPPAWAMGAIRQEDLAALPFRYYETTGGILDTDSGRFHPLALTGYEADRRWRAPLLRGWNRVNTILLARRRPVRIAIHPHDFHYPLADAILSDIRRCTGFLQCGELSA